MNGGGAALAARAGLAALLAGVAPCIAHAHGFGERYDLPAPLGYFIAGAAATVAFSFVVAVLAVRRAPLDGQPGLAIGLSPALARAVVILLRTIGLATLLLAIAAGFWGDPHPAKNIAPTIVWILGWVGLSLLAALVVNTWPVLDPWATLDAHVPRSAPPKPWPTRWGSTPATLLFLLFAWLEVADPLSSQPSHLAMLLVGWTIVNLAGMRRYGREAWQRHADPIAVYFTTLARFAPITFTAGRMVLRPWARGLAHGTPTAPVAFVIAMLSTVLFDGLLGTQLWRRIDTAFTTLAPGWNDRHGIVLGTAGLLATFALFLLGYRLACLATRAMAGRLATREVEVLFAPSLVPIAVAYLVAHNFSYILVQGQGIVALASDPFGTGWNLFGTAGFSPDIGLVGARFTWYAATSAIVIGHIVAVWLAHRAALAAWPETRRAVLASVPLTLVMIAYTAVSLSIVAEPIARYRTPDESYTLAAPASPAA